MDIGLENVINNIDFDVIKFSGHDSELFIKVLVDPLTRMTSVRFDRQPDSKKVNYHILENSNFKKKVVGKINKKFRIPEGQFIIFN